MRDLIKYLIILLSVTLLTSCDSKDQGDVGKDFPSRNIAFTISIDGGYTGTKAKWSEDYTSADDNSFERKIMQGDLRVAVYTETDTRLGYIENLSYWPADDDHSIFHAVGRLPEAVIEDIEKGLSTSYKFMVLANCPEGNEEELTYPYNMLDVDDGAIPMWGVMKADLSPLRTEAIHEIGDIYLLRAAAKVKVKLTEELKSQATLNAVYLNYFNQSGYCLPTGWNTCDKTQDIDQEECIRLYRQAAVKLDFQKDSNGDFFVYLPEYDNINYPEEKAKITVDVTMNDRQKIFVDAISFNDYESGVPKIETDYNIVRNHKYEFTITSVASGGLLVNYTVADWTSEIWGKDEFGNDIYYEEHDITYPTYHNPVVPSDFFTYHDDPESYNITRSPVMHFNSAMPESGAFCAYFQITGPTGVEWMPTINANMEQYGIRIYKTDINKINALNEGLKVYDSDDNTLPDVLNECLNNEWYKILIFPETDGNIGNIIDFGIVYNQKWTGSHMYLYINGEYDNIRWPDSGNNPKFLQIKHVAQE